MTRPITPAELELSDIRLDAQTAAGMTAASAEETEVPDFDPATGLRNGVLLAVALIAAAMLAAWWLS